MDVIAVGLYETSRHPRRSPDHAPAVLRRGGVLPEGMKIVAKKLGREKAVGMADFDSDGLPVIMIDPRQPPKERLDTLIHEALHHLEPDWCESKVLKTAHKLTALIWRDNWRRVES